VTAPADVAQRVALAALATAFVMNLLARGLVEIFTVFVLPLSHAFGWERAQVLSIYALTTVALGVGAPLAGRLFDVLGPRAVYGLGLGMIAAAYLLASVASTLWTFQLTLGLLFGAGAACIGPAQNAALVGRWFTTRLALAISVVMSAAGVGMLTLVPLVQFLEVRIGLEHTFRTLGLGAAALTVASLLLPWGRLRAGRAGLAPAEPGRVDSRARTQGAIWTLGLALRHPVFWGLFAVYMLTSQGMYAVVVQVVPFLIEAGFSPIDAAGAWGLAGVLLPVGMISAGWLDGRIGRRPTLILTYGISLAGIATLWLIAAWPEPWLLALFVALFGGTLGARGPLIGTMALVFFGGPNAATILGMLGVALGIGSALGAWAGGALHDWTGGYSAVIGFGFSSIVVAAGVFLAISGMQPSPPRPAAR
jgi:MFS family permease